MSAILVLLLLNSPLPLSSFPKPVPKPPAKPPILQNILKTSSPPTSPTSPTKPNPFNLLDSIRLDEQYRSTLPGSNFNSTTLKTLFNLSPTLSSLQVVAENTLSSAALFIQNRIDKDTAILLSLGVYLFERAKLDAIRVLPAHPKTAGALPTNSSYVPPPPPPSSQMNNVGAEISNVTQQLLDILASPSLPSSQPSSRTLKNTRARKPSRAGPRRYQRPDLVTSTLNSVYELKQVVENVDPGFRSRTVVSRFEAIRDNLKSPSLNPASPPPSSLPPPPLALTDEDFDDEVSAFLSGVTSAIESPGVWLSANTVVDEEGVEGVVTLLIMARDDYATLSKDEASIPDKFKALNGVRGGIWREARRVVDEEAASLLMEEIGGVVTDNAELKDAVAVEEDDSEEAGEGNGFGTNILLRSIDVVLFVIEKAVTTAPRVAKGMSLAIWRVGNALVETDEGRTVLLTRLAKR